MKPRWSGFVTAALTIGLVARLYGDMQIEPLAHQSAGRGPTPASDTCEAHVSGLATRSMRHIP